MQQRQGTKDVGMEYQFKVITFVAASLLDNDDVQDFIIFSNADNIPGFDDLIIKVWFKSSEQPHVYLGQVKHRHSKINFEGEKHKLADYEEYITKILKHKDQINILTHVPEDNIEFWFYSNNFVNKIVKLERKDGQSKPSFCNIAPDKKYKSIIQFKKPAGCFKFIPKDSVQYVGFFHKFHLFLNQSNNSKIDYDILQLLEFSKESTDKIIKYVDKYLNIPKITGLTKKIFETEVFNIHLSSITVKPTAAIEMNTEQARIWNKITATHDVTIINDILDIERNVFGCFWQQINDIYDCQFRWNDCIRNKGRLTDIFDVQKFVDRSRLQQVRHWLVSPDTVDALLVEMWKHDDLPRILKPSTDLAILRKYKHLQKKFVVISDAKNILDEVNPYRQKIFTNATSICSLQLKTDLLRSIMVSLQGRNPSSLDDIISGDERCMKLLDCHHILDLIKQRKMYLKKECFDETEFMIFIVIDSSSIEIFDIDTIESHGNINIVIRCKYNQVDMYIKDIESQTRLDDYKIHVLQEADSKLEYLKGKITKIRNFLVDQDGRSIYTTKYQEPIPIIGRKLGLTNEEYISRHLRKPAVDLKLLHKEQTIICLVYGDVNSLESNVKEIIKTSISFNLETALEIKENVMVSIRQEVVEQYWSKLCSKNHQIILLKAIDGCLELKKYKNIRNISKYISYGQQTFTENEFFNEITNNLVVLSAEPGMGKSFLLRKLSEICNERDYVLFLNLSDYRRDFQEYTKAFLEDPLIFLFRKIELSKFHNLIKGIYDLHKSSGRLTVFLDSFDEILPFYEKKVLNLLGRIIKSNIRVIISSRLISDGMLVDKFEVQLFRIDPIKRCDLIEYLANKNIKDIDLARIPNIFLENPLYLKFLIFLYQVGSIDFVQVNICDLYHKVTAKIIQRYCYKYNQDYNPEITISTEKFLKNHRLLALLVVFGKETVLQHRIIANYDNLENEFICVDVKLGIVKYFSEGYPVFIHQTFAEFMAMEWLNSNLFQEPSAKVIYQKMYLESDLNVRYFFDSMACSELPLHIAVLNNNLETINRLCMEDHTALLKIDKCGRNALHLASSYCLPIMEAQRYKILEEIVKHMLEENYSLDTKDIIMNWNWVDCLAHKNIDVIEAACYYNLPSILDVCLTGQETQLERYLEICCRTHLDMCCKFFEKSNELLLSECLYDTMKILMNCNRLDIACRLMELGHRRYEEENLLMPNDLLNELSTKFSPLHIACLQNNKTKLRNLLQNETDVSQKDIFSRIPLHYSTVHGSVDIVTMLLEYTPDINAGDEDDNTPLHYALRFLNIDIVTLLLTKGAEVNKINKHGETALHFAIYNWEEESEDVLAITEIFANKFEDIAKPSKHSKSLLWVASYKGFAKVVEILLKNGADAKEQSLLWIASYKGFANIIQILLDHGANVTDQEPCGDTALHWAASKGHKIIFENLIRTNKTLLYMQNDWGQTATDVAVVMGKLDIIKCLLENGVDRIGTDPDGNTLVHVVARWGRVAILETLLREKYLKKSDLRGRNHQNQTPLHLSVEKNHRNIVYFLLNNGVEADPVDQDGCTPLHYATSAIISKLLLDKYNDDPRADRKSNCGRTPLHTASEKGNVEVILQLLRYSIFEISSKDNAGCTPLHLAVLNRKLEAATVLIENGASIDIACNNFETCLHKAVASGSSKIVKFLLKKGANVHSKDLNGNTALHLRIMSYQDISARIQEMPTPDRIINLLLKYGANSYTINKNMKSSLDIAKSLNLERLLLYN